MKTKNAGNLRSRLQRGFTALELIVVMTVSVVAMMLAAQYMESYSDALVNQSAADQQKRVTDAAAGYIKDNYAAVVGVSSAATPATITTAMLKATGYLSPSFSDTNAFGQSYIVLALQPAPNKLETIVATTGGETVNDINIKRVAQLTGASGGYVSVLDVAHANGSFGGWKMPLANYGIAPGAGHLVSALMFADSALISDYLYRSTVAGHPEFNRMNTAIDMAGNNINNGGTFNATTLNASQDVNAGRDVKAVTNVSAGVNVTATNNVAAGNNVSAGVDATAGNNVSAGVNVTAGNNVHASNLVRADGRVSAGEFLHVAGGASEGGGCAPDGLIAQGSGGLLVCSSGVWSSVGSKVYVASGNINNYHGTPAGYTNCGFLYTPRAYNYYDGGHNEPNGAYRWTDYGSSNDGTYIMVCTK